ncbi:MAG: DUF1330 domain-containing protein [Phenylobacterium zucineum]|nr:MAG: DUF1330 domain-containing protein [Phenylobacterium zucineum]
MRYIDPDREAWAQFRHLAGDQPIHMLNLVKVKALATYPEDHPDFGKGITGLEAYRAYGRTTAHIFNRVGGRQIWAGRPQMMVTGPQSEAWDICFIAEYPSPSAFIAMVRDPEYRELVKHRTAGVEDSRLLRLDPVVPGEGFGE